MRVTNERAQLTIKARHLTGNYTETVKDYASDLLESRDIIEKQKAMLREMRELIVVSGGFNVDCDCADCTKYRNARRELLERTKAFA